jgi:hypothetical protein
MEQARLNGDAHVRIGVDVMQKSYVDDRGTVRALAQEIEEQAQDGKCLPA